MSITTRAVCQDCIKNLWDILMMETSFTMVNTKKKLKVWRSSRNRNLITTVFTSIKTVVSLFRIFQVRCL